MNRQLQFGICLATAAAVHAGVVALFVGREPAAPLAPPVTQGEIEAVAGADAELAALLQDWEAEPERTDDPDLLAEPEADETAPERVAALGDAPDAAGPPEAAAEPSLEVEAVPENFPIPSQRIRVRRVAEPTALAAPAAAEPSLPTLALPAPSGPALDTGRALPGALASLSAGPAAPAALGIAPRVDEGEPAFDAPVAPPREAEPEPAAAEADPAGTAAPEATPEATAEAPPDAPAETAAEPADTGNVAEATPPADPVAETPAGPAPAAAGEAAGEVAGEPEADTVAALDPAPAETRPAREGPPQPRAEPLTLWPAPVDPDTLPDGADPVVAPFPVANPEHLGDDALPG